VGPHLEVIKGLKEETKAQFLFGDEPSSKGEKEKAKTLDFWGPGGLRVVGLELDLG
jgi:hypothetical protein